ncbi:FtsX-like permease family protein [Kitasatospora sp. NPDC059571]|uniref:FtsX-like permease family protein n=1 Tax=Kitasatospora sp. NPDC059571 TaxID=3346871 RepID=UPI003697FE44
MIRFALRLAVTGGREAVARLAVITAAVAIGVGLLLSTLASINAVDSANRRPLWLDSGSAAPSATAAAPLLWRAHGDHYDGREIQEVDLAPTGPTSPVPPGLPRLPAAGEYYASPALARLLAATPADRLGDRFPGRLAGVIGDRALQSPDSLVAVIGRTRDGIEQLPDVRTVTAIATGLPEHCTDCPATGVRGDAMTLILSVVAGALIFPVVIFIGTATRLSAARREQRFAAMRLVGATPRQVALIAAVESTVAAAAGTLAGFGLYGLLRPVVATVPFTGMRFFTADLVLHPLQILAVALGVPAAAAAAARFALRRVTVSPLGVSRRVTPRPPRALRLLPLAAGLGELAWFVGRRPDTSGGQTAAYLSGFLTVMLGLVVAGPWLTMVVARAAALRTGRPATLIAVRRLADDPKAGFRAVSGLVLALFVTTATVAIIGTINANRGSLGGDRLTVAAVQYGALPGDPPMADRVPDGVLAGLRAAAGVRGVAVLHANPDRIGATPGEPDWATPALLLCSDLAQIPFVGHCAPGATVAAVPMSQVVDLWSKPEAQWPTAPLTPQAVAALPVQMLLADTDGSTAARERIRTAFTAAFPGQEGRTVGDWSTGQQRELAGWRQLANVVLLTTLPIAGCSLAVSVVAGLGDRKRPFAMLRLTGARLRTLRNVVALESAMPLLVVAAVAVGTGLLAAHLFLTSQMHYGLVMPGAGYFALVALGLVAALGIIAGTLPLLRRITGPEAARNG